jgi:hypothetical protein
VSKAQKSWEANRRAVTIVNAIASSFYQPKGVREGRAAPVTAKATDSIPNRNGMLDLSGVSGGGTLGKSGAEHERPYPVAGRAKTGHIRRMPKVLGAGRESERLEVPKKACRTTRWREGALL